MVGWAKAWKKWQTQWVSLDRLVFIHHARVSMILPWLFRKGRLVFRGSCWLVSYLFWEFWVIWLKNSLVWIKLLNEWGIQEMRLYCGCICKITWPVHNCWNSTKSLKKVILLEKILKVWALCPVRSKRWVYLWVVVSHHQ